MKTRTLALVIVLLVTVSLSFAEDKISIDDIYGTWVNPDYNEKWEIAKIVNYPDGISLVYNKVTDTEPAWKDEVTITDTWYDQEGNLWIKYTLFNEVLEAAGHTSSAYAVDKYSNSGTVRERVWSHLDYPNEMSPIGGNYSIYYRQEQLDTPRISSASGLCALVDRHSRRSENETLRLVRLTSVVGLGCSDNAGMSCFEPQVT